MRCLVTIMFLLGPFTLTCQVLNNDIRERSKLILGAEPVVSNTDNNTVEWACLNKKLTEKCLVYHNDQWFTFEVEKSGDYFINIAAQKCRDGMGVQLIIIEGNPCEVSTYRIMDCIRRIDQREVYVGLSLKANASYLVNVDGFMGDFCEFKIQLSSTPWKLPPSNDGAEATTKRKTKPIEVSWELRDGVEKTVKGFNIYREREGSQKKELIREMGAALNALGANATRYTMSDTLPAPGSYKFEIFGVEADSSTQLLVAKYEIIWDGVTVRSWPPPPPKTIATFPVAGQPGAIIDLLLYNQENSDRLWKRTLVYDPAKHDTMQIDLAPWLKEGLKRFLVVIIDEAQREPTELYFMTDANGNVVQE
jgi:hypothetical protein